MRRTRVAGSKTKAAGRTTPNLKRRGCPQSLASGDWGYKSLSGNRGCPRSLAFGDRGWRVPRVSWFWRPGIPRTFTLKPADHQTLQRHLYKFLQCRSERKRPQTLLSFAGGKPRIRGCLFRGGSNKSLSGNRDNIPGIASMPRHAIRIDIHADSLMPDSHAESKRNESLCVP
jgi:hypothetical protein